jgi:hypothetical protein
MRAGRGGNSAPHPPPPPPRPGGASVGHGPPPPPHTLIKALQPATIASLPGQLSRAPRAPAGVRRAQ